MGWLSTRTTWGSTATSGLSLQSRARFVLSSLLLSLFYFLYHHHCHMMISFKIWISRDWTGYHAWEDGRGNYAWDIGALNSNMMSYSVSRCLFCITFLFPYSLFTIVLLIIIKPTQLFPGTWSSKHELRSVGKECPAANGWHCCYCCWKGDILVVINMIGLKTIVYLVLESLSKEA